MAETLEGEQRVYAPAFCEDGSTRDIPNDIQVTGELNNRYGFTPAYSAPFGQTGALMIDREGFNGILRELTKAVADLQLHGFATWRQKNYDGTGNVDVVWPKGAIVRDRQTRLLYRAKAETSAAIGDNSGWEEVGMASKTHFVHQSGEGHKWDEGTSASELKRNVFFDELSGLVREEGTLEFTWSLGFAPQEKFTLALPADIASLAYPVFNAENADTEVIVDANNGLIFLICTGGMEAKPVRYHVTYKVAAGVTMADLKNPDGSSAS